MKIASIAESELLTVTIRLKHFSSPTPLPSIPGRRLANLNSLSIANSLATFYINGRIV